MKKIVLASNNKHKIQEFKSILKNYDILTLEDIGFFQEIEENGDSFYENAFIKAKAVHDFLVSKGMDYDVIADDSGLCVNALDGQPGIYSARYAGNHNDQDNRNKLRFELREKSDRSAYFQCQIVLYRMDESVESVVGKTNGVILLEERGKKDFGYDCIFYSNDLGKTFGEASEAEKDSVSHRGRAIQELIKIL